MRKIVLLLILLLVIANTCFAETKQIYATGTYIMGDGETPVTAKEKSTTEAMRNAMEQSGVYLESYSQTNNFQITKDEVNMISAGIIEVISSNTSRNLNGNTITFTTSISCNVKMDDISILRERLKELSNKYKSNGDNKWEPITRTVGDTTMTLNPTTDTVKIKRADGYTYYGNGLMAAIKRPSYIPFSDQDQRVIDFLQINVDEFRRIYFGK